MPSSPNVREACIRASSFLQKAGVEEHDRIAEWLVQHILGWSRSEYWLRREEPVPDGFADRLEPLLRRKAAGEPVQYILGEQEFYGLTFKVDGSVLIPRPETELLVEELLKAGDRLTASGRLDGGAPLVADIGTGSGAIPVTVAVQRPGWRVIGCDLSPAALQTARANAERLGAAGCSQWLAGDLLEPLERIGAVPNLLVSNPPYIPSHEVDGLQREVREFEPRLALDGGEDGLVLYRRMTDRLAQWPQRPLWVGLEVGIGQAQAVAEMLRGIGAWEQVRIVRDLAGIERHVIASVI